MRKNEVVDLGDKKITVWELKVRGILSLFQDETGELGAVSVSSLIRRAKDIIPLAMDCTVEGFQDLSPSELEEVWEAFKRVNAVFFKLAGALGLADVLADLKNSFVRIFSTLYFSSLSAATAPESGTMDTDSL